MDFFSEDILCTHKVGAKMRNAVKHFRTICPPFKKLNESPLSQVFLCRGSTPSPRFPHRLVLLFPKRNLGTGFKMFGEGGGGIREVAYVRVSLRTNIAGLGLHLSRETIEDSELKSFNF